MIRNADVSDPGPVGLDADHTELHDIRIIDGLVSEIRPAAPGRPAAESQVVDADGGAVIPGLHDHHIHLLALAAARSSIDVAPPAVHSPHSFDALLRRAGWDGSGWMRAVGLHEPSAGRVDRDRLDRLVPHRPVRVQDRSGSLWIMNSLALELSDVEETEEAGVERGADGRPNGRLHRLDSVLRARLADHTRDLGDVGRLLAGRGVTAVADMTPFEDPASVTLLGAAKMNGTLPFTVLVSTAPALAAVDTGGVALGPVKVLLDEDRLPAFEDLVSWFRSARTAGRAIAVHCITRVELMLALAAFDSVEAAEGDRIEHGALIPVELLGELRERRLTVVTQPGFITTRGDEYAVDVPLAEQRDLWRCGTLIDSGVTVAAGTDAPFGHPDPWLSIAAAVQRRTAGGLLLGPDERISAAGALDLFLAPVGRPHERPRRVRPGQPADLCVLATPLAHVLADPTSVVITATITGDRMSSTV